MKLIRKLGRKLDISSDRYESYAIFWCDFCSQEVEKRLSAGKIQKSCGCNHSEFIKQSRTKHGGSHSRLFKILNGMKDRCLNPNNKDYLNYGGRGITICNEWLEFIPFRDWALNNGYQENLVIDRKENAKGYNPENCRWVTIKESNRNRDFNKLTLELVNIIRNEAKTTKLIRKELAKKYNISLRNLYLVLANDAWVD